jgi:hypothetical protein
MSGKRYEISVLFGPCSKRKAEDYLLELATAYEDYGSLWAMRGWEDEAVPESRVEELERLLAYRTRERDEAFQAYASLSESYLSLGRLLAERDEALREIANNVPEHEGEDDFSYEIWARAFAATTVSKKNAP